MSDDRPNMFAIIKAEMIWIVLIVLAIMAAYKAGVFAEKIGALEDIVFNQGIYKQLEREAENE